MKLKNRIVSLCLALAMVLTLAEGIPMKAKAADIKAEVFVTAQDGNAFITAPQKLTVDAKLAESYGYTDELTDCVSALDVLVAEHIAKYGEADFSKNKANYLVVTKGKYGWTVDKSFGKNDMIMFAVDEKYPGKYDATSETYAGYTINQALVKDGGKVEFFFCQDTVSYGDLYAANKQGNSLETVAEKSVAVDLAGYSYVNEGYKKDTNRTVKAIADAQLATVDEKTGAITKLDGSVTDKDGKATVTFDKAGSYLLTAYVPKDKITSGSTPIVMPIITVNVKTKSLTGAKIYYTKKEYTYTGNIRKPSVIVKMGSDVLKKNTDYTIKYSANKNVGTAKVVIKGKGNYTGTKTFTFKINPKKTTITKVVKGKKKLTVKWKKVSGVTGYKIYRSTKKTGSYKYVATVKKSTKTSYTNKKLKSNKTYYYKVVTYKKVAGKTYKSGYSAVKSGKTSK